MSKNHMPLPLLRHLLEPPQQPIALNNPQRITRNQQSPAPRLQRRAAFENGDGVPFSRKAHGACEAADAAAYYEDVEFGGHFNRKLSFIFMHIEIKGGRG